ncbi:restriction endonuclease [Dactylosporangium sp. NPDC006015]|uniref:McrC family protein n=1 Tax=Dactylosporangium sp. NPDC006015 TaxID=3154576 RepID=UPI0033A0318C
MLIELDELGPAVEVRLTDVEGRRLAASGVVEAVPSRYDPGVWLIRAAGKVGVAQVGGTEVWVRPKVPIDRLLFLLGYASNPTGWRDETVDLTGGENLLPALAHALWRQANRALRQGLLQGYQVREEALPVLRGRLREGEQLRRHHGAAIPVEVRYDEFTSDIAENQLLRAATQQMLRVPRVDQECRRRLRHLLIRLGDVTPLVRGQPLPQWYPTRLNTRYHTALRLAEVILRGTSVEHAAGATAVNGFMLDMPRLFEDFVTVAIAEALQRHGGRARRQDPHYLDQDSKVRMRPDLVWHRDNVPAAVIDAKYKSEKPAGFPQADLYQMLAYCTALDLTHGHLIYARGNEQPARHTIRSTGVQIICHALDLGQHPSVLLAQATRVADIICATACVLPRP